MHAAPSKYIRLISRNFYPPAPSRITLSILYILINAVLSSSIWSLILYYTKPLIALIIDITTDYLHAAPSKYLRLISRNFYRPVPSWITLSMLYILINVELSSSIWSLIFFYTKPRIGLIIDIISFLNLLKKTYLHFSTMR